MFTINRNLILGLVSSMLTAGLGYVVRFIVLNYFEYDLLINMDNWAASLGYFCSLGGVRYLIREYLKENTFLMYNGAGSTPVGSNTAGYNSSMQAPNNSGIGSSSAGPSSIPGTADNSTTGVGSSSAGDASNTNAHSALLNNISKRADNVAYYREQLQGCNDQLQDLYARQSMDEVNGLRNEWNAEYVEAMSALKDTQSNLHNELRMEGILKRRLESGNYSVSVTPTSTKRTFNDSSMANDASSTPTNNKR